MEFHTFEYVQFQITMFQWICEIVSDLFLTKLCFWKWEVDKINFAQVDNIPLVQRVQAKARYVGAVIACSYCTNTPVYKS